MNQYKIKEGERFQNGFDENNLSEIITILTETSPPDAISMTKHSKSLIKNRKYNYERFKNIRRFFKESV